MEKDKIKEIFYATDDSKNVEIDENNPKYKEYKKKEDAFMNIINYNATSAFEAYIHAYEEYMKEQASVYYERGFKRGAETMMCILKK